MREDAHNAAREMVEAIQGVTMRRTAQPMDFVHNPTERQQIESDSLRAQFKQLRALIQLWAPDCRERSLAITHLEDAQSRAVQAIMYHRTADEPDE